MFPAGQYKFRILNVEKIDAHRKFTQNTEYNNYSARDFYVNICARAATGLLRGAVQRGAPDRRHAQEEDAEDQRQ